MDRYSLIRYTYREDHVEIYREYVNQHGEKVVEIERRARPAEDAESDGEDSLTAGVLGENSQTAGVLGEGSQTVGVLVDLFGPSGPSAEQEIREFVGEREESEKIEIDGNQDLMDFGIAPEEDFSEGLVVLSEYMASDDESDDTESVITVVENMTTEDDDAASVSTLVVDDSEVRRDEPDILLDFEGSDLESDSETLVPDDDDEGTVVAEGEALGLGDVAPPVVTGRHPRYCYICQQPITRRMRRHVEDCHVPWWLTPTRACWICEGTAQSATFVQYSHRSCGSQVSMQDTDILPWTRLANGLLTTLAEALGCASYQSLLERVCQEGWYPRDARRPQKLSFQQKLFMWLWEREAKCTPTPFHRMGITPPTSVCCLLHHAVILCILPHVSAEVRDHLQRGDRSVGAGVRRPLQRITWTIDAHCHLDSHDLQTYEGRRWDASLRFSHVVANFVFPFRWSRFEDTIADPRVFATAGIHPTVLQDSVTIPPEYCRQLSSLLAHPRCVGLGEVGLDYVRGPAPSQRFNQQQHLKDPLGMAVVLHCRGDGTYADALEILTARLPVDTCIQLHCFMGDMADRDAFLGRYPKTIFSFSAKCLTASDSIRSNLASVIRGLRLDQIVIESDYPYISRSPQADFRELAVWIGIAKGICPALVLEASRRNTIELFNLPVDL